MTSIDPHQFRPMSKLGHLCNTCHLAKELCELTYKPRQEPEQQAVQYHYCTRCDGPGPHNYDGPCPECGCLPPGLHGGQWMDTYQGSGSDASKVVDSSLATWRGNTGSQEDFRKDLESLLNRYSMENGSNTPDFVLAQYLQGCLMNFDRTITAREKWYGR